VQGAILADLLSLWLPGHAPQLREEVLAMHVEKVRELVAPSEAEIFADRPMPPDWSSH
jgi:hypothetical protein